MGFCDEKSADPGDEKCDDDLRQIVAHGGIVPFENELVKTLAKQWDDGQDGPQLNDDGEHLAGLEAADLFEPLFGDQQMARRGNGNELGDSFNETQQ